MSNHRARRARRAGVAGLAAACTAASIVAWSAGDAAADPRAVIGVGPDQVYGTNPLSGASATVSALDLGADGSQLVLDVTGVAADPGTELGAHLHVLPCGAAPSSSGGHYVHPDATGTLQQREVWLDFTVDGQRRGRATATRPWSPTDRANRSVVIHVMGTDHETGAAGSRLACIDLDA